MSQVDRRRALGGLLYGADYNPEQWPEQVWDEDVRLMQEAGITTVSLGIFSWSRLQPAPDAWDFGWLDTVIDKLHAGGIGVNLATATASPPPWLSARHPDVLAQDENGATYWPGSRQHHAPSSPTYRHHVAELVRQLARRYGRHPAVVMWHVNNELGCHLPLDFSDNARDAFRGWLRDRYGTVDALNDAWGTSFWSQRYGSFDEVFPPRKAPYSRNPGGLLDFQRFSSDMLLECFLLEKRTLREEGATQPVTTNLMGPFRPADYFSWADHLDVIADDHYPDPTNPDLVADAALHRDLMRCLKPGRPWILMEQATNQVNWRPSNPSKLPGRLAAESAQCIGRGADGIMFFQWRQSRSGSEKFHSAVLPHAGTDTSGWREASALGASVAALPELPPPGRDARVALVFDWENWWAVEGADHPVVFDYLAIVRRWYRALHARHVMVDLVPPERVDAGYDLAIAPQLYLLRDAGAAALVGFVEAGGTLLVGAFSDVVDEHDRFRPGGFLTQLGGLLGVRLEDFSALVQPESDGPGERFAPFGPFAGGSVTGTLFAEVIHAVDAEVVARFTSGHADGRPAMTRRNAGAGAAWYLATVPDEAGTRQVVDDLLSAAGVRPVLPDLPDAVEVARRADLVTLINHGARTVTVPVAGSDVVTGRPVTEVELPPNGFRFVLVAATEPPL